MVGTAVFHIIHPSGHAGILPTQNLRVAIGQIDLPRTDGGCITPCGSALLRLNGIGNYTGNRTAFVLLCGKVGQPFGEEFLHIVVVAGGFHEYLGIAGPTETFVPLGAVGGYVEEIAFLTPDNVVKQLVKHRIGAL